MIHKKISSNSDGHYGTNVNMDKTHVLLQVDNGTEQVRIKLTADEVDQIINDLQKCKSLLLNNCTGQS